MSYRRRPNRALPNQTGATETEAGKCPSRKQVKQSRPVEDSYAKRGHYIRPQRVNADDMGQKKSLPLPHTPASKPAKCRNGAATTTVVLPSEAAASPEARSFPSTTTPLSPVRFGRHGPSGAVPRNVHLSSQPPRACLAGTSWTRGSSLDQQSAPESRSASVVGWC